MKSRKCQLSNLTANQSLKTNKQQKHNKTPALSLIVLKDVKMMLFCVCLLLCHAQMASLTMIMTKTQYSMRGRNMRENVHVDPHSKVKISSSYNVQKILLKTTVHDYAITTGSTFQHSSLSTSQQQKRRKSMHMI